MKMAAIALISYGVLALGGGIMGYVKSQSLVSLISGIISGILLCGAGGLELSGIEFGGFDIGKYLGITIAAILVLVFIVRLIKTRKFMPAGIMIIAGIATLSAVLLPI